MNVMTVIDSQEHSQTQQEEQAVEKATATSETQAGPEGPIIDKISRDDVVSGQDEVDDLLSSLGF